MRVYVMPSGGPPRASASADFFDMAKSHVPAWSVKVIKKGGTASDGTNGDTNGATLEPQDITMTVPFNEATVTATVKVLAPSAALLARVDNGEELVELTRYAFEAEDALETVNEVAKQARKNAKETKSKDKTALQSMKHMLA